MRQRLRLAVYPIVLIHMAGVAVLSSDGLLCHEYDLHFVFYLHHDCTAVTAIILISDCAVRFCDAMFSFVCLRLVSHYIFGVLK